ncbi:hypothetical protein MPER_01131, partial [Moniliophthora perniciosa FA553]
MQAELVDSFTTPLASSCTGFYAKIIDDAFTHAECEELLNVATLGPEGWKPAGAQAEKDTYRNSARALVFDENVSKRIFDRLKPFVEAELGRIEPYGQWAGITGDPGRNEGPVWALDSVNPRLSFVRYGPGQYFKPHWDGQIVLEDGALKSFVTLQLYLSDNMTTGNIVEVDDAPVPAMNAESIDFASTSLASSYTGFYAKIIDNAFTPAECDELIHL